MWDEYPYQLLSRHARKDFLVLRAAVEVRDGVDGGYMEAGKVGALLRVVQRSNGVCVKLLSNGRMFKCWNEAQI